MSGIPLARKPAYPPGVALPMAPPGTHQEEEALGKAYDARLMRRLLRYLRPYRLYVVGRDGRTAVIKLGPEYELLALNELDDNVDASPVFVGDRLYLRGRKRLYALEGQLPGR